MFPSDEVEQNKNDGSLQQTDICSTEMFRISIEIKLLLVKVIIQIPRLCKNVTTDSLHNAKRTAEQ